MEDRPNPVVGFVTGGTRALATQFFSFYVRVPVKLFRPARIDYTAMLKRSIAHRDSEPWSFWRHSNPALIVRAIHKHGWRFIPDQLLPPIIANSVVGTVLYSTYLLTLHLERAAAGNTYPTFGQSLFAGGVAGAAQAAVATPLDAIAIRFANEPTSPKTTMWKYGVQQLQAIGTRAAYGGITLNLFRESTSYAVFFASFELVKGPLYRSYARWWYSPGWFYPEGRPKSKVLYPTFVLMGGCVAAAATQLIGYPLSKIQKLHTMRLQAIDQLHGRSAGWHAYLHSYEKTWEAMRRQVATVGKGSWLKWLYGGSFRYTLVSMPSSSIGLLVFEIMRVRFSPDEVPAFGPETAKKKNS